MLHQRYYLIRPKPALLERISPYGEKDIAPILRETELWSRSEGDRTWLSPEDWMMQVKLLWQMGLRHDYGKTTLYQELFGQEKISVNLFDQWWELERYGLDENYEDIEQSITADIADEVVVPHNLAQWLEDLKAHRIPYNSSHTIPNIKLPPKHNRTPPVRKLPKDFPK